MSAKDAQSLETICVHAGVVPDPQHGAIMTPIFQTSTYVQPAPGQPLTYDYSRGGNPTRAALETSLAALERAKHAISFASGLAAEQAIMQSLEPGARIIVSEDVYGGTGRLFRKLFARYGFQFDFLDLRDLNAVAAAVDSKTKLFWVETPTNPLLRIVDIAGICAIAKKAGAKVVVDNTFISPIFQQPLTLGADIVVHSTTKYIGGHSDLIGGALMTNDDELAEKLRFVQFAGGAVNSPFESFMLLRSIKTLALRMERHNSNALAFARAMEDSGDFASVIYPGLESHPQHALARKQMSGYAGVVSVYMKRDMDGVSRFLKNLRLLALAESLGGVESLVNHPEQMTHASVPPDLRQKLGINAQLLRFSIGIENVNDLIADVRQALQR
ncbi:aminotransferase class I/II-fold pyridoxal phosphate-dependent enzyme [Stigmatella sp. ncwal1]|uniref:Aminotransferase class I/II-fold pyridoxal phosphate-dependent enzyme n=1 Tax=Stigmatella ashevillensis TaxID=2995309 RepID=A0ABT5DC88_9BACT|nr:aminotransferase class I/II-fold pyridoxal phosphate-dependent enzyme [Stigmatella ashevillena]MDC0709952.1 aminotransferase class I/II-fold pyridoxal phosphate-dependent enzyme [Stigmatella ashevillena]